MLLLKLPAEEYEIGQQSSPYSQWYKLRNERHVLFTIASSLLQCM